MVVDLIQTAFREGMLAEEATTIYQLSASIGSVAGCPTVFPLFPLFSFVSAFAVIVASSMPLLLLPATSSDVPPTSPTVPRSGDYVVISRPTLSRPP